MIRQHHTTVDTWADLRWTDNALAGLFTRMAAVTSPVKGGQPISIYEMTDRPNCYWIMNGSEFVTKKGSTSPAYLDTLEAACYLYSWLHPEQKEPTDETEQQSRVHRFYSTLVAASKRP